MDISRIPLGNLEYFINEDHCCGRGYSIGEEETKQSLQGQIYNNHHLVEDLSDLREDMASLATTEFEQREIEATLASFSGMEPWRIGETMAECWLENHRNCVFPWRMQADIRSLKASLPGTDLVGMTSQDDIVCFAFGEVKTSGSDDTPPSVVYGEKGLPYQLKALYESDDQRRQLILHLGIHIRRTDYFSMYKEAICSHIRGRVYCYWGIMLRDTDPTLKDLEYSVTQLSSYAAEDRPAEFVALYLGVAINDWPTYCRWEARP